MTRLETETRYYTIKYQKNLLGEVILAVIRDNLIFMSQFATIKINMRFKINII